MTSDNGVVPNPHQMVGRKESDMLVLSRQRDETIMIGDDIEITIVDIRGDKVRLGINCPKEIGVHRKEVYDAIKRESRDMSQVKPDFPEPPRNVLIKESDDKAVKKDR